MKAPKVLLYYRMYELLALFILGSSFYFYWLKCRSGWRFLPDLNVAIQRDPLILGAYLLSILLMPALLFSFFLPRRKWAWVYHFFMIASGLLIFPALHFGSEIIQFNCPGGSGGRDSIDVLHVSFVMLSIPSLFLFPLFSIMGAFFWCKPDTKAYFVDKPAPEKLQ